MATAAKKYKTKKVARTVYDEECVEDGVTLTLTNEEARVLLRVVGTVSGYENGSRGKTSAVYEALANAGVVAYGVPRPMGSLHFTDGDDSEEW